MKLSHISSLVTFLALAAAAHTSMAQTSPNPAVVPSAAVPTHIPALTMPNAAPAQRNFVAATPTTIKLLNKPVPRNQNCLAIRSYNYTADANNPQLSGSTTCTVAKTNSTRYAIAPATRQP